MKQVFIKRGTVIIEDVPAPLIDEDEILVQVYYSCISAGTEIANIKVSEKSLIRKALDKPQDVKKILENLRTSGLKDTIGKVKRKIETSHPIGYSASGIVLEIGKNIKNIKIGDRVACMGDRIANHAEFIAVPENLIVKIPGDLSFEKASTVTLGSIALQGIRRCDPKLGEFVTVIGLGILGQLTAQMLKASGCKVIGLDLDTSRIDRAIISGMDAGFFAGETDVPGQILRYTGGQGADAVIITASSEKKEVINDAMKMCRKKGKVVIVGAVSLDLEREDFYKKEIDLLISTSYGPGRYDEKYENKGFEYPYAYIRWTENRNMQEYLSLISSKRINIDSLIEKVYKVQEASSAYDEFKSDSRKPLIVLLEYNKESSPVRKIISCSFEHNKDMQGKINVAIIGAGNFAQSIHLPNLKKLEDLYNIYAVHSKLGNEAKSLAEHYNASYSTTDFREILSDEKVSMVLIATPHNLHASIAKEAAIAGKAVFLEKPMALNNRELCELADELGKAKVPFIVDFNRRFAPVSIRIKELLKNRINPVVINYTMNAGFIPGEHWVHSEVGGGRNIGEACHIYDLFNFFTDSEVKSINAAGINPRTKQYNSNDNFIATLKYEDGSLCNLVYTALGSVDFPKEQMEIYFDNKILFMDDYKSLKIFGSKEKGISSAIQDKGLYGIISKFGKSVKSGEALVPLWQLIQATEISFEVEKQLNET
jgi:predicted dehydrogenase/threonine dehydrogenase-like Zn-dependent dehydrogenase